MFRTTTLRSALTAAALATALLVPTAAQATHNTGAFQKTQAGRVHSAACDSFQILANYDSDQAYDAYHSGDKAGGAQHAKDADQDYGMAKAAGCAWAG